MAMRNSEKITLSQLRYGAKEILNAVELIEATDDFSTDALEHIIRILADSQEKAKNAFKD